MDADRKPAGFYLVTIGEGLRLAPGAAGMTLTPSRRRSSCKAGDPGPRGRERLSSPCARLISTSPRSEMSPEAWPANRLPNVRPPAQGRMGPANLVARQRRVRRKFDCRERSDSAPAGESQAIDQYRGRPTWCFMPTNHVPKRGVGKKREHRRRWVLRCSALPLPKYAILAVFLRSSAMVSCDASGRLSMTESDQA